LLVQVEEIKGGRGQIFDAGEKNSSLQLRHRSLELRRDECERLVLDPKCSVEVDRLWN